MTQKEDKIKLIIQSLEKIYIISKEEKIDIYKKLVQENEEYCDNMIKDINNYVDNQKMINSELIVWLKKDKNNFKEQAEKMVEQSEIENII